mgnify:CR=1 FL=1
MLRIKLTDVKDTKPGAMHKQFWFTWPDGKFLSNMAVHKPFYKYMTSPKANNKRWMRIFEIEVEPYVTRICRYVQRGHKRAWVLYTVGPDGTMVKQGSAQGSPPWMTKQKPAEEPDGH